MQLNTILYNTNQYKTNQYHTIQCKSIPCNTIQINIIQYKPVAYNAMHIASIILCDTNQQKTIQHNRMWTLWSFGRWKKLPRTVCTVMCLFRFFDRFSSK